MNQVAYDLGRSYGLRTYKERLEDLLDENLAQIDICSNDIFSADSLTQFRILVDEFGYTEEEVLEEIGINPQVILDAKLDYFHEVCSNWQNKKWFEHKKIKYIDYNEHLREEAIKKLLTSLFDYI